MPYICPSSYKPPFLKGNHHFQTIYHSEFRSVPGITYEREKIATPDGDFINIDWHKGGHVRAAIIVHGLESSAERPYMKGMVRALALRGFDCAALNLRGCGGEINSKPLFYHAGKTDDVDTLFRHIDSLNYSAVAIVGFSLGGNIVLKYVGESGRSISPKILCASAVSAPCDLTSSSDSLERFSNRYYNKRFVKKLARKVREKHRLYPGLLSVEPLKKVKSLRRFDDLFTAPLSGYRDAADYYANESSRRWLKDISVPTLLINAMDDPFLGPGCFPVEESEGSKYFYFEAPEKGGHIGFYTRPVSGEFWHETRVADFLTRHTSKKH